MLNKKHKFDLRRPKVFKIKETDSLKKIDKMQRELKETITQMQKLYDEIQKFRDEKAFKEAFNE
jgi:hypothetical protein